MDEKERQTNIYTLYQMAQHLEHVHDGTNTAELLYVEAADQADKYLPIDSELRAKVLIGCIDFYDSLDREQDSMLMQERLRSVAVVLWEKLSQTQSLSDKP